MVTIEQEAEVKQTAEQLLAQQADWVAFYRDVLSPKGVVRNVFTTPESLAAFERSETYQEILRTLKKLRESDLPDTEPTRVITVRLPKTLHQALRDEAFTHHTSMNKLCISKLLELIDGDKVPRDDA
ncbi:MAG: hypothetical protein ABFC96_16080 [Thermoguttaceae bacterium]